MDPRDHPFDLLDGAECAACGRPIPADRIRILAQREELAFAELPCEPCGSVSLAIFAGMSTDQPGDADRAPFADAPALGADDVLDMHLFLDAWDGDLRSLVGGRGPDRASGAA
jgi:hypothetical protein